MIDEKRLVESLLAIDNTGRDTFPIDVIIEVIQEQPQVEKCAEYSRREYYQQGYNAAMYNKWILFKTREADTEEKDVYGIDYMLCGKLPEEDEQILVTYANGSVDSDTFLRDGCECYLDSGAELAVEAIAWMPLPEPYKIKIN